MLVGYVSDDRYVCIPGVSVLFENSKGSAQTTSLADGSIRLQISPGPWRVTLNRTGYGAKVVAVNISDTDDPIQFRLLDDCLMGYAWPKWVQSGEQSEFRVHSPEQYYLSLWRYGWEQELVRPVGWFDEHGPRATIQITPDGDYSQTGVAWNRDGYSSPHHRQYQTAPEKSGLYFFHAKGESGAFFSFPWIVAPSEPTEPIAVLASNVTWNAYNSFGGRSNYIHPDRLPPTPTVNSRLELKRYTDPDHHNYDTQDYAPLSFDRPEPVNSIPEGTRVHDPIAGRAGCHLAAAEWRLLGWLEREGFGYDYYAETQLHFGQLPLSDYRVLIISTHPEYWSRQMYETVRDWVRHEGGRLVYLGGNGLNCDVEFLDAQTCIYRNEDDSVLADPDQNLESRFHIRCESEANLLGVVYDPRGIMTAAPYEVCQESHWIFEGTGLKNGDQFGHRSLHERIPGGASGHETDKISPSSPPGIQRLAHGLNPDGGGADLTFYSTPSGGAVFSAGSITWPSSILVDEPVSMITANVLRKFLKSSADDLQ